MTAVGEAPKSNEASATPTATDSTSPTIAIGSPSANSVLTRTSVTVTGTASDDVAVDRVELSTDGTTWTRATGTTSWSGTVTLQAGANVIYARATDTSGNQQSAQVSVTAQVARPGPTTLDLMLLAGIGGAIAIPPPPPPLPPPPHPNPANQQKPPPPPPPPPRHPSAPRCP